MASSRVRLSRNMPRSFHGPPTPFRLPPAVDASSAYRSAAYPWAHGKEEQAGGAEGCGCRGQGKRGPDRDHDGRLLVRPDLPVGLDDLALDAGGGEGPSGADRVPRDEP